MGGMGLSTQVVEPLLSSFDVCVVCAQNGLVVEQNYCEELERWVCDT